MKSVTLLIASFAFLTACSSSTEAPADDGGAGSDATIHFDAGPAPDSGTTGPDGSTTGPDGSVIPPDAYYEGGPMPTLPGGIGAACVADTDCSMMPGEICQTSLGGGFTFPGGYCSAMCTADPDCGPGAQCVPFVNFCAKTCTTDDDCRAAEGYTCGSLGFGGGMYCLPPRGMPGTDGGRPRRDGGGFPGFDGSFPGFDGSFPGFDGSFPGFDGSFSFEGGFPGFDGGPGFPGFDGGPGFPGVDGG